MTIGDIVVYIFVGIFIVGGAIILIASNRSKHDNNDDSQK